MADNTKRSAEFDAFMGNLKKAAGILNDQKNQNIISDNYRDSFNNRMGSLEKEAVSILDENRRMRIAVVGQVKAGKSSFLNAVLFDGEDVLPKAATPMTASLTRIVCDGENYADICFFDMDEWRGFEKDAKKYDELVGEKLAKWETEQKAADRRIIAEAGENGLSEAQRRVDERKKKRGELRERQVSSIRERLKAENENLVSAKEIVDMVAKSGQRAAAVIAEGSRKVNFSDIRRDLVDYVGADGAFTPFVKYIELHVSGAALKGDVEVIDTPGLGDPVISRGLATQKFLKQCDLAFVLSRASHFLDQEDIELIHRTLPRENIHRAVLIGTKFDSALNDYNKGDRPPIGKALCSIASEIMLVGKKKLRAVVSSSADACKALREMAANETPIQFASAIFYTAGRQIERGEKPDADAIHSVRELVKRFSGIDDLAENAEMLKGISNIERIRNNELKAAQEAKDAVMEEKRAKLINTERGNFLNILNEAQIEAEHALVKLRTADLESLRTQCDICLNVLGSTRRKVSDIFVAAAVDAQERLVNISNELKNVASRSAGRLASKTKEKYETYTTGHLWWKKEHRRTYTVKAMEACDAARSLDDSIRATEEQFARAIGNIIDIEDMRSKIIRTVDGAFAAIGEDYDRDDVLIPINRVLREIRLPDFALFDDAERDDYVNRFARRFGATVEGDEIYDLKSARDEALRKVQDDIAKKLAQKAKGIHDQLESVAATFVDDVQERVRGGIDRLTESLADKEESLVRYGTFVEELSTAKKTVAG